MITPTPWFVTFESRYDDRRHYLFFEYQEHAEAWQKAQDADDASEHPMSGALFFQMMLATLGLTYGEDVVIAHIKDEVGGMRRYDQGEIVGEPDPPWDMARLKQWASHEMTFACELRDKEEAEALSTRAYLSGRVYTLIELSAILGTMD